MINKQKLLSGVQRAASLLLASIMTAALILPAVPLLPIYAEQAGTETGTVSDDSYLSGTDFEDLEVGKVISENISYSHKIDGKGIYNAVPKNSKMTVMQERGNNFIRIERSARGKENNVTNDPYFDFLDTKKSAYTGDFVVEASFRLNVHPDGFGNINLLQFINRDNGNFFQPLLVLTTNRTVKHHLSNTDFTPELGEWFHVAAVIHRNTNTTDTMDVYINSICVARGLEFVKDITSIDQLRIAQLNSDKPHAACMDVDDVSVYKGSEPRADIKSGADSDTVIGKLDLTHPSLPAGGAVTGKLTAEQFEIDAKNEIFGVQDQLGNLLFKMDHHLGKPYIDVFANGAGGALVADVGLMLGSDWQGSIQLLSPYASTNGYTSRENFIRINGNRQLADASGNVLAELGSRFNRISIALSADRKYVSVYVNGEEVMQAETKYGVGYILPDGFRMLEFEDRYDSGTVFVSYAEIYRGATPAVTKEASALTYYSSFSAPDTSPLTFSGTAGQISGAAGYSATASAGSHIKYPSELTVNGLSVSFKLTLTHSANVDILKLGSVALLSTDTSGRLIAHSASGDITLFSLWGNTPNYISVCIKDGHYTLYLNGLPFVTSADLPSGVSEKATHLEFLSVKTESACAAFIDDLEIYEGGIPYNVSAPAPRTVLVPKKNSARLFWTPLSDADGYKILRSADGDEATDISGLLTNADEYTDTAVWGDIEYAYTVAAVYKRDGAEYLVRWQEEPLKFSITDNDLYADAVGIEGGVKLTWKAYPSSNLGYLVYRAMEEDGEYTALTEKPIKELTYVDTTATAELIMFYKVCVVLDKDGTQHVFGLKGDALEAAALYKEETEDGDTPPDPPLQDGVENSADGFNVPECETENIFESDFNTNITNSSSLTLKGEGINWTQNGTELGNGALKLNIEAAPTENSFAALKLSQSSFASTVIDVRLYVTELNTDTDLLVIANENAPILTLLKLTRNQNGAISLLMGDNVGGEQKLISTVSTGEWLRITVWINASGDKVAFYLNGSCTTYDAELPKKDGASIINDATELMLFHVYGEAQETSTLPLSTTLTNDNSTTSILLDDLKIKKADLSASSFMSAVLTPKVTVGAKENLLKWRAANGALYYTVWRAGEDGVYVVIKDKLLTHSYTDSYEKDCTYKITYTFDVDGIELTAITPTSGVLAKKPPVSVITDAINKLFDFSKPGTLGITVLSLAAVGCSIVFFILRKILKIDTPLPQKAKIIPSADAEGNSSDNGENSSV